MAEKVKLPRSSYDELVKIIKAYARQEKPVLLSEINKITGMSVSGISANLAFLLNIGLIEGAQSKKATNLGAALGRALEHGLKEEITSLWEKVVKSSDFLSKMTAAVSIREGMETASLENHIAYSAGETKASYVATGARAVIEILKVSEVVIQEGDRIIPNKSQTKNKSEEVSINNGNSEIKNLEIGSDNSVNALSVRSVTTQSNGININIEIQIQATVDQIDDLGEKLASLIKKINPVQNTFEEQ